MLSSGPLGLATLCCADPLYAVLWLAYRYQPAAPAQHAGVKRPRAAVESETLGATAEEGAPTDYRAVGCTRQTSQSSVHGNAMRSCQAALLQSAVISTHLNPLCEGAPANVCLPWIVTSLLACIYLVVISNFLQLG